MRTINRIEMEDFKRILNEEITLYSEMEQYLAQKKQIIIQGDLNRLVQVDDELEKLTQRAQDLEQERIALMVSMGREGDTLRDFIASLETGEDTHLLTHARSQLVEATESIKTLSLTNRDLLTQSIRFIEQSVGVIASILTPEGASYTNLKNSSATATESRRDNPYEIPSTISREA
jgi:flagellar biosynthesis/type III secretory pathway chaperone